MNTTPPHVHDIDTTQATQQPAWLRHLRQSITRVGDFLVLYWAHLVVAFVGIMLLAAYTAPLLSYLGFDAVARTIFFAMHFLCAQTPSHSFYLCGHQACLCERCTAIYSSLFCGGLAFLLSKKRLPGISWWMLILFSIPMALDGFTQMFGLRESNWWLRLITGGLFGIGIILFTFPLMQKSLDETVEYTQSQTQSYEHS